MFRIASILLLGATMAYVILRLRKHRTGFREIREFFRSEAGEWKRGNGSLAGKVSAIAYYANIFLFLILFITGMFPAVILGVEMTGLWLIIHVQAALLFSISFPIALIFRAERYRFIETDLRASAPGRELALKLLFWLLVLCAITAMFSIILMLYPIVGTRGMENLVELHRYSVLALSVAAVFHCYLSILYHRNINK
jgi:hypothetical protein